MLEDVTIILKRGYYLQSEIILKPGTKYAALTDGKKAKNVEIEGNFNLETQTSKFQAKYCSEQ